MMLYPKNGTEKLDQKLFRNPTSEYRAAPFWAWNCELNADLLKKEIDYMHEMGFGGYMMHPRVGMATPLSFRGVYEPCARLCGKG